MAKGFKCGAGGGAGLNFKVVAYASAGLLPASAPENTIAIITEAPITSWILSATEPENPTEGMVWVAVALAGNVVFNALKKNALTVCPVTASQYIEGAWVEKTAKSYQKGAWVEWWDGVFYNAGTFSKVPHSSKIKPSTATLAYGSNYIKITTPAGKASEVYEMFGPVDLSNFSTLEIKAEARTSGEVLNVYPCVFLADCITNKYTDAIAIATKSIDENDPATTIKLDISALENKNGVYIYAGYNTRGASWQMARSNCRIHYLKAM